MVFIINRCIKDLPKDIQRKILLDNHRLREVFIDIPRKKSTIKRTTTRDNSQICEEIEKESVFQRSSQVDNVSDFSCVSKSKLNEQEMNLQIAEEFINIERTYYRI